MVCGNLLFIGNNSWLFGSNAECAEIKNLYHKALKNGCHTGRYLVFVYKRQKRVEEAILPLFLC